MIHDVKKLEKSVFLINNSVKLTINEDVSVTAEFNDQDLTEDEVNELIDQFFIGIAESVEKEMQRRTSGDIEDKPADMCVSEYAEIVEKIRESEKNS